MAVLFSNNASATLSSGISDSATSITVQAGEGALFPALSGGNFFYATLVNSSNQVEIVKVTARTGDTMTVERGQDGTQARAFQAGDKLELRVTAAALNNKVDRDTPSFTGNVTISKNNPVLSLDSPTPTQRRVDFLTNGVRRWSIMASNTAEDGNNTGSPLVITAQDDNGNFIGNALSIDRASRVVTFNAIPLLPNTDPVNANDAARKAYVDAKVSKSGDTMTGPLSVPHVRGGPGDAGTLKCHNTTNTVNFRWGGSRLHFRVDEALEKAIATTDDVNDRATWDAVNQRVSKSGDTMTGALAVPYIRGGPGDAGTLRTHGGTNTVNFRWDSANLMYRVDESLERIISYISDARIKTDIRPSEEDALSVLRNIPLYSYSFVEGLPETFKEGHAGRVPLGLTAQDLEARGLGFAVRTSNQPDGRPACVPRDLKAVQMEALVPYLIRAVQQQQEQIEALRQRVAALEGASTG